MDSFTDYYVVLGVDSRASADTIKAAFKKLALKYHPDVYKGEDAEERMRLLLLAYQTLGDPASRRNYDALRSEHLLGTHDGWQQVRVAGEPLSSSADAASRARRRDSQRPFVFPNLSVRPPIPIKFDLGEVSYQLGPDEAHLLERDGMLRGIQSTVGLPQRPENYCHRCRHRWAPKDRSSSASIVCPACKAGDWAEYLLLRCVHCQAVFESEEIRDKILGGGRLYNPYELFPLCPNCRRSQWCPAENARVETLRRDTARRRIILWMSVLVVAVVVIGVMAAVMLK